MKSLASLFILLSLTGNSCSQTPTASLANSRPIASDLWGVSGANTIRDNVNWQTEPLLKKLPELHPMLIRYPGSNTANFWDWHSGWLTQSPYLEKDFSNLTKGPDKPEDFKKAIDLTGATPIWTVNMLTSDIQDQLAMLRHVKSMGMSIELVELGAEFFLPGNDLAIQKFPTGADYAREANRWIDSIKKYFPETKCAVIAAVTKDNKSNRRNSWNEGVASIAGHADAVTFHVYPPQTIPKERSQQQEDPAEVLSEPFRAMDGLEQKDLRSFSSVQEIWITEYNMNNNTAPVQGSWLHGIYAALISMKFLEEPRITHTVYFTMCGRGGYGAIFIDKTGFSFGKGPKSEFVPPPNPPATTPWAFTAAGYTMSIYGDVVKGKNKATQIRFDNIPQQKCGTDGYSYPSVYGWKFSGGTATELLLLNLSSKPITIQTSKICSAGSHYSQAYSDAYTYVAKGTEMKTEEGTVNEMISLKPFSITRIMEK